MDFAKYVSFLEEEALYFARSDLLGDNFEGSTSQVTLEIRREHFAKAVPKEEVERLLIQVSREAEYWRQWTYVNCRHINENESAAM
jgi:hypothetical protein